MSSEGRRWLEVGVRAPGDDERAALLVDGLMALGGRAAEERDGWYVTHLESPADVASFETEARQLLTSMTGVEDLELRTSWREHQDWAETWKRGLGFRRITERIAVRPSWVPEPGDAPPIVMVVDPGMAFGTAEHGTTRGCLRLLDRVAEPGQRILDVGAGSGVLAIAASLLGAAEVVAIEADALACEALAENLELNGVGDRVRWVEALVDADELEGYGPADGIVANIESGTLARLLPGLAAASAPNAWLILSGILVEEWPELRRQAEEAGFDFRALDEDGEW
ncbi:MAG: 50S ribosomal protein L11 methyltransferase, partial [Gemmatimonadota bacterium]